MGLTGPLQLLTVAAILVGSAESQSFAALNSGLDQDGGLQPAVGGYEVSLD